MSHRPGSFSEHPRTHGHEQAGPRRALPPNRNGRISAARENGYTLSHAGKRVRIGPVLFWGVVGSIIVMGAWSAATVTYFTFRDDVLTRLVARQAEMQYAYEDRIAELRAQIDRTTSRQLLDQEQFEQKLDQIQRRQISLEQRTSALGGLPDNDADRFGAHARTRRGPRRPHHHRLDQPQAVERHRRLRRAARPRGAARIAHHRVRQSPEARRALQDRRRRQCAHPPEPLARRRRRPADGGAEFARGEL